MLMSLCIDSFLKKFYLGQIFSMFSGVSLARQDQLNQYWINDMDL